MNYTVEGGVAHIGTDMVLSLSKEQIAARAHALEKVDGGHRPKEVVQFKAGERIGLAVAPDKLPRTLADVLVPAGKGSKGKAAKDSLRTDGPTVAEFVEAGYPASSYPPEGYASRSSAEEIAAAVAAEAK